MDKNGFKIHAKFRLHPSPLLSKELLFRGNISHFSQPLMDTCHLTLPVDLLAFYLTPAQLTPSPQHWLLGSVPHMPVSISCQPALDTNPPKTGSSCY